jgi:hypothetical protein
MNTSKEFKNIQDMQDWINIQRSVPRAPKEKGQYDDLIEKLANIDQTLKEICQNLRK